MAINRVVLVTGGAGALGSAYCTAFAKLGYRVMISDIDAHKAHTLAERLARQYSVHTAVSTLSVDSPALAKQLVQHTIDTFGRVDVLINNAGTLRDASLVNMTDSQWQHIIDLHLSAAFYLSRAVWTHMKKQAFGRIIMTSSASGLYGNYGQANYSAAKMALVGLANTLAKEGQRYNIKVNSIAPIAKSTMTEKLLPPDIAKLLSPEAIVPLVLYLSHPSCSENGAIFEAGGGYFTKVAIVRGKGMRLQASSDDVEEICRQMKSQIGVFRVESDAPDGPVAINSRLGDASGLEDSIKLIISSSL